MGDLPVRPSPRRPVGDRVRDWIVWFGVARLLAIAGSVLAIGAGGFWLLRTPASPVEASLPFAVAPTSSVEPAPSAITPASIVAAPTTIVVHVAGAVVAPGVHELSAAARVVDAVAAAGGLSADAHPDALNLAAPLHDGDRVYVPVVGEVAQVTPGVTGVASASVGDGLLAGPVDINTATIDDLDTLPGVGPATASAIISHREQQGPFSSIDELAEVRGIGPAKLESLRGLVTV